MTGRGPDRPGSAPSAVHPDEELLEGYATGSVDQVMAWSVESHLTACGRCRSTVAAQVGPSRLARNREAMLVRVATTDEGLASRLLARVGVPDHVRRLLAATPSLRLSWVLSVVAALAVLSGEALLARHLSDGSMASNTQVLLPFVLTAPLLVLASVAGAFLPWFDPAYSLAVAAPFSGFTLLLIRSVFALASALVPVVVAAFVVPGAGWLPAALLLPSFALSAIALAGAVMMGPRAGAIIAAALWTVPVLCVGVAQSPQLVVQWRAQVGCAVMLIAAAAVLAWRRDRFEIGWSR